MSRDAEAAATITVHPHGELTSHFERTYGGTEVVIAPGITIRGLLKQLGIPEGEVWVCARNGTQAKPEDGLEPGDVLEIFSPVAGGS
jgi:sulfur carrier protein ThiS